MHVRNGTNIFANSESGLTFGRPAAKWALMTWKKRGIADDNQKRKASSTVPQGFSTVI
jgi:hypothetical protein